MKHDAYTPEEQQQIYDLHEAGFVRITEPYSDDENWMLENACRQLRKAGRPYRVLGTQMGNAVFAWPYQAARHAKWEQLTHEGVTA